MNILKRKIEEDIIAWDNSSKRKVLLIKGSRKVGKTTTIGNFCASNYEVYVYINFRHDKIKAGMFKDIKNENDFLQKVEEYSDFSLVKNNSIIFIDEVDAYPDFDLISLAKFLAKNSEYRFIFSASLVNNNISKINKRSVSSFLTILEMFTLDFHEFLEATNYSVSTIKKIYKSFKTLEPLEYRLHHNLLDMVRIYLLVGGYPEAVSTFVASQNIKEVSVVLSNIYGALIEDGKEYAKNIGNDEGWVSSIKKEYTQYADTFSDNALNYKYYETRVPLLRKTEKIINIENKNKYYKLKEVCEGSVIYMIAGLSVPVYRLIKIELPLGCNLNSGFFKLYYGDTGLFSNIYLTSDKLDLLNDRIDKNYEAIYENFVAQEISSNIENLYYYDFKKTGKIDFIFERNNKLTSVDVECQLNIKENMSLDNALFNQREKITSSYRLTPYNISAKDGIIYLPFYMAMCIGGKKRK
jgi:predicted AAA+ superfamily ATPase